MDIDPITLNLDPEDAIRRAESTPNLRAVLTADLAGRIANLGPLRPGARNTTFRSSRTPPSRLAPSTRTLAPSARTRVASSVLPTKNLGALGDAAHS